MQDRALGNAHIFVNSVDFISKVINIAELSPDDVKVVCSLNPMNQRKIGEEYPISKPLDMVRKINFYTSTSFEGCDIYDPEGKTYIVSDKNKKHSLLDISTLCIQICGRIRNSIYDDSITHIFTGRKYDSVSLDEYKAKCLDKYSESISLATSLNSLSASKRLKLNRITNKLGNEYMKVVDNNLFEVDENLLNLDILNFKIHKLLYQNKITVAGEYQKQGFVVNHVNYAYYTDKLKATGNTRISFEDLFLRYAELCSLQFGQYSQEAKFIEQENPLIKEAYNVLGVERVTQLNYKQSNIKREIIKKADESNFIKTARLVLEQIGLHKQIEIKVAKMILREIYLYLGISKRAKATDLKKLFYTKETIKNSVRYIELIQTKIAENVKNNN